jgi:hypothetical protein
MEHSDMVGKLWDIANYVTGFAVAQVLATSFGIAKKELKALKGLLAHWIAFGGTLVFTVFYITAIWWCGHKGLEMDGSHADIWHPVTEGRMATVLLFTFVLICPDDGAARPLAGRAGWKGVIQSHVGTFPTSSVLWTAPAVFHLHFISSVYQSDIGTRWLLCLSARRRRPV